MKIVRGLLFMHGKIQAVSGSDPINLLINRLIRQNPLHLHGNNGMIRSTGNDNTTRVNSRHEKICNQS